MLQGLIKHLSIVCEVSYRQWWTTNHQIRSRIKISDLPSHTYCSQLSRYDRKVATQYVNYSFGLEGISFVACLLKIQTLIDAENDIYIIIKLS
jgi:hypothetical protein